MPFLIKRWPYKISEVESSLKINGKGIKESTNPPKPSVILTYLLQTLCREVPWELQRHFQKKSTCTHASSTTIFHEEKRHRSSFLVLHLVSLVMPMLIFPVIAFCPWVEEFSTSFSIPWRILLLSQSVKNSCCPCSSHESTILLTHRVLKIDHTTTTYKPRNHIKHTAKGVKSLGNMPVPWEMDTRK